MLLAMLLAVLLIHTTALAGATNAAGEQFLAENKLKEDVVTLPSGLQYKILRPGDGQEHPLFNTRCDCHYEGRTVKEHPTGKTFDSSYARGSPATFSPDQASTRISLACAVPLQSSQS
jgi:FKBP-type peptidyl-prolyl cis-trans isomerase